MIPKILRSLMKIIPIHILKLHINAIVQPHFYYGDVVCDSMTETDKIRLQKLDESCKTDNWSSPRTGRNSVIKELS